MVPHVSMYLFFAHSYVASKIETKEKNVREINDEIKEELLKSLIDGEIEFKLDGVGNFEKTTAFIKKGVLNLAYISGLSFEKSKKRDKFKASKTRKSTRKTSKTRSGNKF